MNRYQSSATLVLILLSIASLPLMANLLPVAHAQSTGPSTAGQSSGPTLSLGPMGYAPSAPDSYLSLQGGPFTSANDPPVSPYSFLINTTTISGTRYYYAYDSNGKLVHGGPNNTGGAIGTSFYSVFTSSLASNEKIDVGVGSFILASAISTSVNNVVLEGQGSATNISLSSSFDAVPFTVSGNNWLITQIRMDARNQVYGRAHGSLYLTGNNDTVSNSYFNRGDHGQIYLIGTNDQALYNQITFSYNDGIIVQGMRDNVIGNFIYKTTDYNCISMAGFDGTGPTYTLVRYNTCVDSGNYGIALENEYGFIPYGITISGNTVISPALVGIGAYSAGAYGGLTPSAEVVDNSTISGNTISYSGDYGIRIYGASKGLTVENNIITNSTGYSIDTQGTGTVSDLVITGNQITYPLSSVHQIVMGAPTTYLTIAGNVISNVISTGSAYGIVIYGGATNCVISNNMITMQAGSTGGGGIATENAAVAGCVISGNTIRGASSSQGTAINFAVATTYAVVSYNKINTFGTGIEESPSAASNHNIITGNTADNNGYGFLLVGSSGNTLTSNTADNNGYGFLLVGSSGNTLTSNTADNNGVDGFSLQGSSNNTLTGNTASGNGNGMVVMGSQNALKGNILTGNMVSEVTISGFTVLDWSKVSVTSQALGASQPSGTGPVNLTSAAFYDVRVVGVTGGTAALCITGSVNQTSVMKYWNGTDWVYAADQTVSGADAQTICGDIPVSELSGTVIVKGLPPVPSIFLSPSSGAAGTSVTVTGFYLVASHNLTVTYDRSTTGMPTTCTTDASGSVNSGCAFKVLPSFVLGSHVITASDGANNLTATFTVTLLGVTCSKSTVLVGSAITCKATVHESGAKAPIGTVTWSSSSSGKFSKTSCKLSKHKTYSTCSVRYTPTFAGSVVVRARYGGDSNDPATTGGSNLAVTMKTSRTTVSCSPKSVVAGSPKIITCKAKVIGYRPTGSVSWSQTGSGSVSLSSATCTLTNLKNQYQAMCSVTMTGTWAGTVTLQAAYGADPNNLGSYRTARLTITVSK